MDAWKVITWNYIFFYNLNQNVKLIIISACTLHCIYVHKTRTSENIHVIESTHIYPQIVLTGCWIVLLGLQNRYSHPNTIMVWFRNCPSTVGITIFHGYDPIFTIEVIFAHTLAFWKIEIIWIVLLYKSFYCLVMFHVFFFAWINLENDNFLKNVTDIVAVALS